MDDLSSRPVNSHSAPRIVWRRHFSVPVLLLAGFFLGCGGLRTGPAPTVTSVQTGGSSSSAVTGNWEFDLEPSAGAAGLPLYKLTGALSALSSGSAIVGVLRAASTSAESACVLTNSGIVAVTGTIDSSNNVTLTGPLGGGTLSIFGSYSSGLSEIFGNLNIAGGSCALAPTAMQGDQIADLTGTWVGTMQNVSNTSAPTSAATATFSQSGSPNADGSFSLSGTISLSGACTGTYSFPNGTIAGASFSSEGSAGPSSTQYIAGSAPNVGFSTIPSATVMLTGCASIYSGALAKQ